MRVLIAEDEYCSRLNLIRQVKECIPFAPEEILEAENGKEAWEILDVYKRQLQHIISSVNKNIQFVFKIFIQYKQEDKAGLPKNEAAESPQRRLQLRQYSG